jgi:hypothetical protein
MNKEEARQILAQELKFFNDIEYLELTHRVGENRAYEKKPLTVVLTRSKFRSCGIQSLNKSFELLDRSMTEA